MVINKIYCFVDESGQNTQGRVFVVSVVVTAHKRNELFALCEQIEQVSGKRKDKWGKADHGERMKYLHHIFVDDRFKGCLRYEVFRQTIDYDTATIEGIVSSVKWGKPSGKFTTMVYIDGLKKTKRHEYGARLRRFGLAVRKVQGVARDETNALTRLADAIAGFVLDALDGKSKEIKILFKKAKKEGMIIDVST
jgi:hypothetical protein